MEKNIQKLENVEKKSPVPECHSCGIYDERIRFQGIEYCPNALCVGPGSRWFRKKLTGDRKSHKEMYHVDYDEWLQNGVIYNRENGIEREHFFKRIEKSELMDAILNIEFSREMKKKWVAKNVYERLKKVIDEVESSSDFCINVHWDGYITVDNYVFNEGELNGE